MAVQSKGRPLSKAKWRPLTVPVGSRAVLAMQEVEGSSPFIRSQKPWKRGIFGKRSAGEGTSVRAANVLCVERAEAEAILDGDRETAIGLLLRLDELVEANQRLVEANERLEARVAELERRLNRSSRNSSLPPSQDPPSAPPRPRGKGSGRKRGGQPGHEGRYRRLLPPEQVDEIVEHWPERCRSCAHVFAERERVDAAEPSRHQVAELPPIAVRVSEHRLHRVCCPACATRDARPSFPPASRWAFGPRLQAAVVTLAVRNRVSRRDTTELARELFGVELSTGTVDAIIQRAGEALAAPLHPSSSSRSSSRGRQHRRDRLEDRRRQPHPLGRADQPDRGVPDRGRPARLRGQDAARRALRRDRLLRPLARLRLPRPHPAAALLGPPAQRLHRPQRRHGRAAAVRRRRPRRSRTTSSPPGTPTSTTATGPGSKPRPRRSKRSSARCSSTPPARARAPSTTATFAKNLLNRWPALWTFTHTDGVEPTNNHAERGLRGAVIYRKLSLGSQSEQGERTIERLLSASITCRLQQTVALRLPHRSPRRPHPRRPNPRARLTAARA